MLRRVAAHPKLCATALVVLILLGSFSVSSAVEVLLVGTSWLGLESSAGVTVTIICSVFSLVGVAVLLYAGLSAGYGEDDEGPGGDDDDPPKPEGPSGEPAWWPEFEREFTAYLEQPEHSHR